ncbi:proline dehydrogenase family protein [bacterium]|nr:proline dehydrogenase family protein [bacterium]
MMSPLIEPALDEARVEAETRRIGREIFAGRDRLRAGWSGLAHERLGESIMEMVMGDEELRHGLLRFVDAFPALHSSDQIARHFEEYLAPEGKLSAGMAAAFHQLAHLLGRTHWLSRYPVAWSSRRAIRLLARRFIAGNTPEHAAARLNEHQQHGFMFSVDLLGELVVSESEADAYQCRYLEMIEQLGQWVPPPADPAGRVFGPHINISIKLSSLTARFDPIDVNGTAAAVMRRVVPLLEAARDNDVFINIDMEHFTYRDLTLEIIRRLLETESLRGWDGIGMVAQAYLRDAETSLESMLEWLRDHNQPMTIRLVKGAYWDSEVLWASQRGWPAPVLSVKRHTDAQYERMTRRLLAEHAFVRTAIASHNVRSIAHALALANEMRVPQSQFELQMLYGMSGALGRALVSMGRRVRIYTPCGEPIAGMAYLVRRILENTSNESFLRQASHAGDEERLLADPKETRL